MFDRQPTLADICSAIEEGNLIATLDGSEYHINALELRRYLSRNSAQPSPVSLSLLPLSEAVDLWDKSSQASIA